MASPSTSIFGDPLYLTRQASPYLKDSHYRLQKELRQYVSTRLSPHCAEWEEEGAVPADVLERHAKLGYAAVSIYPLAADYLDSQRLPADIKPAEWDGFHDLIFIDEIARCGYLGVIWALSCGNSIGAPPLVNFGSDQQKRRFLPDVLKGRSRFCLGVTEPDGKFHRAHQSKASLTDLAGSDVAQLTTTAERRGNNYIVNGAKKWITNAIFADFCMAAVRTGGDGAKGVSALIIPLKAKGVTCKKMVNSGVLASGKLIHAVDRKLY